MVRRKEVVSGLCMELANTHGTNLYQPMDPPNCSASPQFLISSSSSPRIICGKDRAVAVLCVVAIAIAATFPLTPRAAAATLTKANNINNLNSTSSWVGGVVPGSTDIALWNSTVTGANTVSLGADLNFGEIQITNPAGLVTINAGNTLTLSGVSGIGIDMRLPLRI